MAIGSIGLFTWRHENWTALFKDGHGLLHWRSVNVQLGNSWPSHTHRRPTASTNPPSMEGSWKSWARFWHGLHDLEELTNKHCAWQSLGRDRVQCVASLQCLHFEAIRHSHAFQVTCFFSWIAYRVPKAGWLSRIYLTIVNNYFSAIQKVFWMNTTVINFHWSRNFLFLI